MKWFHFQHIKEMYFSWSRSHDLWLSCVILITGISTKSLRSLNIRNIFFIIVLFVVSSTYTCRVIFRAICLFGTYKIIHFIVARFPFLSLGMVFIKKLYRITPNEWTNFRKNSNYIYIYDYVRDALNFKRSLKVFFFCIFAQ